MDTKLFSNRFEELVAEAYALEATKIYERGAYFDGYKIDGPSLLGWSVKAKNLLRQACGDDSVHARQFVETEKPQAYRGRYEQLLELLAVLKAAQEDYAGGYLNSVRNLVQAEVFERELEQARELLKGGYMDAAAVIAGVVLETFLRQLCIDGALPGGNLNAMNAQLVKAGVYNQLMHKRITALAEIRNNAAHGIKGQFDHRDVARMIDEIEQFLSSRL